MTRRHWRKGRGTFEEWLKQEVRQECRFHGLPEPSDVQVFFDKQPQPVVHPYFGVEFLRGRKGEAPISGYGFHLVFDQEIKGPFALGSLAHLGWVFSYLPRRSSFFFGVHSWYTRGYE